MFAPATRPEVLELAAGLRALDTFDADASPEASAEYDRICDRLDVLWAALTPDEQAQAAALATIEGGQA